MPAVNNNAPPRIHVIAALIALSAALIARALLQLKFREAGFTHAFAADLSYLVVPPILAILLFPVFWRGRDKRLRQLLGARCNGPMLVNALIIGVLLRLAWWCHVIAGVALGIYQDDGINQAGGPVFTFQCPPLPILATGVLVMAILVPIVEETIHRGLVQSYLHGFGPVIAIAGSAAVFTAYHPPGSWGFAALAGVVFGAQYWITRSLWPSIITHATVNGLIQLDWRCLRGQWNPPASELPYASIGVLAASMLVICGVTIIVLLRQMHRGENPPR
jgi:membrane protease YdiL (CAAX protease family)